MKQIQHPLRLGLLLALLAIVAVIFVQSSRQPGGIWAKEFTMPTTQPATDVVGVKLFNKAGELVGPVRSDYVFKTEAQWLEQLGQERFTILRRQGTERPGTCEFKHLKKEDGVYVCAGCRLPLFFNNTKFESGSGWPSFYTAISPNLAEQVDNSHGMVRTEIHCLRCNGHMGHVFNDGPKPTGLRYCVDGLSLEFVPAKDYATLAEPEAESTPIDQLQSVVFAGGCFWCTEAVFEPVKGVLEVTSGYAGGKESTADYKSVCSGTTDHAEVIKVLYDPTKVNFDTLLELFFTVAHDPTQLNRQGNDVGRQYRSAVFYKDDAQKKQVQSYIDKLQTSGKFSKPIVTALEPLTTFYPAEDYHQDYVKLNPGNPYVRGVAIPKVEKLFSKHSELIKEKK
jgi:peptide methionine sulfoxide reductase msrA/msrB